MSRKWKVIECFAVVAIFLSVCGCHSSVSQERVRQCDSLCDLSYKWLYKERDSAYSYAVQALHVDGGASNKAQALAQLAFIEFMRMDFIRSRALYVQAGACSNNILYQLVSEIGLMRLCQQTSENEDFYMHRNTAQRLINRIKEESDELNEHEHHVFQLALQEFHTISATYFLNLQQSKRAASEIKAFIPDENLLKTAPVQWLSINYLKSTFRLVDGKTYMEKNLNSFDALVRGLHVSKENGYTYFIAKYQQGLAILLNRPDVLQYISEKRSIGLQLINEAKVPLMSLPEIMAKNSLKNAEQYGSAYLESVSWRVLGSCYFRQGDYEQALNALCQALEKVNGHYKAHYRKFVSPHLLELFNPTDSVSIEKRWMSDPRILTVPEWIARIREQLSMVYSALGDKVKSDYNRNIYLDILEITRQDKETEIRYRELQQESRQLNSLLAVVILCVIVGIFILYYVSKRWNRSHYLRILKLRKALEVCRSITSAMPENVEDEEELFKSLSVPLVKNMKELSGNVKVVKEPETGEIRVMPEAPLSKDGKIVLDVISCFMTWAYAQGKNIVLLGEKYKKNQEERAVLERQIFEYKKENEIRRACISLVNNVIPFIDRMLYELTRLKNAGSKDSPLARRERYEYIGELVDKINEYNELLTKWIQIRRGMFNLRIESFPLQDLFSILSQRQRSFEREGKTLHVISTTEAVKADKLLTLFMLNTLVENALKFTSSGDTISVFSSKGKGYVELSVADTGIGLSEEDCQRILCSKVYDSSAIGIRPDSMENVRLKKKKGSGFGLMNCKGIIEKYRKTNALFQVCSFGIDSTLGKGSRFFFRLPVGNLKSFIVLVCLLCSGQAFISCDHSSNSFSTVVWKPDDPLLREASSFADSVYYCNVYGRYDRALQFADSARQRLNAYYLRNVPSGKELLKAYDRADPVELSWFRQGFNTDYHVILDIRNESAVAALALRQWDVYKYNNNAYTSLFKLLGEDYRLGEYCRKMQRSSNNKIVLLVVFFLFAIVFSVAYYILYFRRRSLFLINLKQMLMINKNLLDNALGSDVNLNRLLTQLRRDMGEIVPLRTLSVVVAGNDSRKLAFYASGNTDEASQYDLLKKAFEEKKTIRLNAHDLVFPLLAEWGPSPMCIGALRMDIDTKDVSDSVEMLAMLLARSLANYLFHAMVRPGQKKQDVELAEDENRRLDREASRLYVQNQVLDNCLSTIKHETMFYPSRIRQLVEPLTVVQAPAKRNEQSLVADMYELAAYYKRIYSLLSQNVNRQLVQSAFKCADVDVKSLMEAVFNDYARLSKKRSSDLLFSIVNDTSGALVVKGDKSLLYFLFSNLMKAAFSHPEEGSLKLVLARENGFVRFTLTDTRHFFDKADLRYLFSPEGCNIRPADGVQVGTEYLICKQIIRDHAEYTSERGCRINAELLQDGGYAIWFTVLESKTFFEDGTF